VTKQNWRDTAELVGIAAIVASLVLVAYELRQNSEIAAAEADSSRYLAAVASYTVIAENPELAELIDKSCGGEKRSFTDTERVQIRSWWTRVLLLNQWGHRRIPESEYQPFVEMQRSNDKNCETYRQTFEQRRDFFTPEFIDFMQENVFGSE
jgi:hypothetical protein